MVGRGWEVFWVWLVVGPADLLGRRMEWHHWLRWRTLKRMIRWGVERWRNCLEGKKEVKTIPTPSWYLPGTLKSKFGPMKALTFLCVQCECVRVLCDPDTPVSHVVDRTRSAVDTSGTFHLWKKRVLWKDGDETNMKYRRGPEPRWLNKGE